MNGIEITIDVLCFECGYNLRGLNTAGRCPECNAEIKESIGAMELRGTDDEAEFLDRVRKIPYLPASRIAKVMPDAVMCVHDALSEAVRTARASSVTVDRVSACQVCEGFKRLVNFYFNDRAEGMELLAEWGIHSSEDVGRIIFAMIEAGMIRAHEGDRLEDFHGQFTLDTLFDSIQDTPRSTGNFIQSPKPKL